MIENRCNSCGFRGTQTSTRCDLPRKAPAVVRPGPQEAFSLQPNEATRPHFLPPSEPCGHVRVVCSLYTTVDRRPSTAGLSSLVAVVRILLELQEEASAENLKNCKLLSEILRIFLPC